MEEIKNDLLGDLKLSESTRAIEILSAGGNRYIKDFRLNMKSVLKEGEMSEEEIILTGIALAYNCKCASLISYFESEADRLEIAVEKIADAISVASLLSANNVFYRFRHFVSNEDYAKQPAKLRMNIMARNTIGKELYELISLAVSAVNGCEVCVASHEQSLRNLDVKIEKIWHSIRLASVVESASKLMDA